MESENVHHQHQLQDQLVGSPSSLPIPPSYGVASTHSWTPTPSITLNTGEFNPSYNGAILHSRQKNYINLASPQNSSMIQDWANNEGSFTSQSCHELQHLAKIKEELSESLTRFTEMLSDTSSIRDSHQLPPTNYLKINEQKDLHDLSEKLLLKTISSGFPMFSAGLEFYSTTQNCSIPAGNTSLPSRGNFSQIYPSINISNLTQASSPNIPSSFDMNLEALDLLSPARFNRSSSFSHPSYDQNNLGIYKESPFGLHHHHFQQSNQRPAYSPSKISPFPTEITEAKRPSILAEPKTTAGAVAKKSRLESRASFPPFKVRKEKLGDRIAALQQLVAPFGKTDTASVLMEAIGYIKFLQNQVETLSVPYMKSSHNKTCRSKQGVGRKDTVIQPYPYRLTESLYTWRSSRILIFSTAGICCERGKMVSLQGPVISPAVRSKQVGVYMLPVNGPFPKERLHRSDMWGYRGVTDGKSKARAISRQLKLRKCKTMVQCSFSSSSDGNGSMAENFNENDEDYVNSSVVEAVEVRSGADGFMIKMRDGRHLRCVHNNPPGGHLPDYAPHPAIVLKMEDGTGLLLPIIVLEMPSVLLMAAVRNVQIARPTMYQVMKDMIDKMGYSVKLVRVTKRVHEAYFAQLCLTKVGDESESVSFDLRPSDAINIAVRCKVPIQVNKYLAYSDGMRVIESGKLSMQSPASDGLLFTELDRPSDQHCLDTEEFNIVCNLNEAINQERYKDAADLRDKLGQFRAQRNLRKYT
ncbi:hypothetical protein CRYUN_Cryun28dG0099000 [Craigia yunnanensis]